MGKLNLHDGDYSCNGRKNNAEDAESAEGAESEQSGPPQKTSPTVENARRQDAGATPRFSCGFGWDKMAGEGLA